MQRARLEAVALAHVSRFQVDAHAARYSLDSASLRPKWLTSMCLASSAFMRCPVASHHRATCSSGASAMPLCCALYVSRDATGDRLLDTAEVAVSPGIVARYLLPARR